MQSPTSPRATLLARAFATSLSRFGVLAVIAAVFALLLPCRTRAQVADSSFWRTDGTVDAIVQLGSTVYVGGSFSRVAPYTGGLVPIDPASGSVLAGFPIVKGYVKAIAPDGAGGWFIGGRFASVGGVARTNLARLGADFTVSGWNPGTNGAVSAIAVHGGRVYVTGEFTVVGGQPRTGAASLDLDTGAVSAWDPAPNASVLSLAFDGGTVFACGWFSNIGGRDHQFLAALDTLAGASSTWDPNPDGIVYALEFADGVLYAGGSFTTVGGESRTSLAALDPVSGSATGWNPGVKGQVQALAASGSSLYVGGTYSVIGGQARRNVAALDRLSGAVSSWNPAPNATVGRIAARGAMVYLAGYFTSVGARSCRNLAAVDSATAIAAAWDPWPGSSPLALAASSDAIWAGGAFTSVGGVARANLAALDATTGVPTAWAPNPNGTVRAIVATTGAVYAGGDFTQLAGQPRSRLGAVDAITGSATAWTADADAAVNTLVLGDGVLYAGGAFRSVGGAARQHLAALALASGSPTAWSPNALGTVYSLALHGTTLYAGGTFLAGGIMALSTSTGLQTGWQPVVANGAVRAIAVSGQTVFVGGTFTAVNGTSRPYFAALDAATGYLNTNWNWTVDHEVDALLVSDGALYAGGYFSTFGGLVREGLAVADAASGQALTWDPNPNGAVYALAAGAGRLFAGGTFTYVGTQPMAYLGAIEPAPPIASPAITLTASHPDQPEGSNGWWTMAVVLQLSSAPDQTVIVDYATADSTATVAGHDYLAASGMVTFLPGETVKAVYVQVNGDLMHEQDEAFLMRFSVPSGARLASPSTYAILRNDDAVPGLSVANVALPEGASGTTPFTFTLTLSNPTDLPVTVHYTTADGSAVAALGDYVAATGVATVPAESLTTTVTVMVDGDLVPEPDESFFLDFSNIVNATLAAPYALGTILNDDVVPSLSVANVSQPEGASGTTPFTFTVRLSNPTALPVTVHYTTVDGSATVADGDYAAASGVTTVPPESLTTTITVLVNGDSKPELDEVFYLDFQGVANATLATSRATATILTDDLGGDVSAVRDVTADQGGWVWLDVVRNVFDDAAELVQPVATYNVWRLVPPGSAEAASLRGAAAATQARGAVRGLDDAAWAALDGWPLVVRDGVAYLRGGAATSGAGQTFPPGTWAIVNSFAALQRASYTVLAPAQTDSPSVAVFVVSAHTIKPAVWYVGHPDSGWSVDNIAPGAPANFVATATGASVKLAWGASAAADLACFRVFRGAAPGFATGPATLVQQTTATEWTDDPPAAGTFYYQLAAVDSAGNESPTAQASAVFTGGDEPRPAAFALGAPSPSPSSGPATMRYALPREANVRLTVYDAAGRRVRELVSGVYAAGVRTATWDGRDAAGERAPAGLYLCRMDAGGFRASCRIVLVR